MDTGEAFKIVLGSTHGNGGGSNASCGQGDISGSFERFSPSAKKKAVEFKSGILIKLTTLVLYVEDATSMEMCTISASSIVETSWRCKVLLSGEMEHF